MEELVEVESPQKVTVDNAPHLVVVKEKSFTLDGLFNSAELYVKKMDEQNQVANRQKALELAVIDAATNHNAPFTSKTEERADIRNLGVPDVINPAGLFEYAAKNVKIPEIDPYDMEKKRSNPAYTKFIETEHTYRNLISDHDKSTFAWVGALALLLQSWDYHRQKDHIAAELAERELEMYKDTRAAESIRKPESNVAIPTHVDKTKIAA